jgi:hypothetical protein
MLSALSLDTTYLRIVKAISLIDIEIHQERAKAVWVLAASPPLTISSTRHDERTPEDAVIIRTLQFLAEKRSQEDAMLYGRMQLASIRAVGQSFTRVVEATDPVLPSSMCNVAGVLGSQLTYLYGRLTLGFPGRRLHRGPMSSKVLTL